MIVLNGMGGKYFMIIKRILIIISIVMIIIVFFTVYENCKGTVAIKYEDIDKSRDYMICSLLDSSESTFSVIYDSQNRKEIRNVNFKNGYEQLYKFNGYFNDYFSSFLNTYVIYGNFDYDEETHDILISDFDINFIYPIKRYEYPESNKYLPKDYTYRYETSWIIRLSTA